MSLELFYAPGSCAFAAIVLLEEAGADYVLNRLDFAQGEQRSSAYLAINPLGRVPALRAEGETITELSAILTYIAAAHPKAGLLPSDPLALARTYELLSWFSSSFHAFIAQSFRGERFSDDPAVREQLKAPARRSFIAQLDRLEALYGDERAEGLVGNRFGPADAFGLVVWRWAAKLEIDTAGYPNWTRSVERQLERHSVVRAVAAENAGSPWLAARAVAG